MEKGASKFGIGLWMTLTFKAADIFGEFEDILPCMEDGSADNRIGLLTVRAAYEFGEIIDAAKRSMALDKLKSALSDSFKPPVESEGLGLLAALAKLAEE